MQVSPLAAFHVAETINIAKLQELRARNPKGCGVLEVAPGVWSRVDCHAYTPATKAIAHLSTRKVKMVSARQTAWKPLRLFSSTAVMQMRTIRGIATPAAPGGERAAGPHGVADGPVKADSVPGTVDHRADNVEGPVKDQGAVGSCTAFSLSSTVDNAAIRAGKMQPGSREQATSPNHVWSAYGVPQMGTAADANLGRTLATLGIWTQSNKEACKLANPMYEDCGLAYNVVPGSWRTDPDVSAKVEKANASGSYKIAGIEKLQTLPPNMDELTQALAGGSDLWIAMKIDGYAWSNSKMKNGVIPDWNDPSGGHAITMSGYRDTPSGRQFLIHNSWGESWGDKGYAWVSEAMVQKYMHYAYKVKLSDGVKKDDMTDDDCSPDELIDIATGFCGLICPDDSRPNNGCGKK